MLIMTFLAFAGNTCYPVFLRLVIWTMSQIVRKNSSLGEPLQFLLDHPRRCYTLLFPSTPTWILFGVLFVSPIGVIAYGRYCYSCECSRHPLTAT